MNINFVYNNNYAFTNAIYSMWLCKEYLNEDILFLTGDLVFESKVVRDMINSNSNTVYAEFKNKLNNKDFKFEVGNNGYIKEISVNVVGKTCFPIYKISKLSMEIWMAEVDKLILQDKTNLYAEDAFNNISDKINLMPMYTTDFCMEIDDHKDLLEAKKYYKKNDPLLD